MSKVMAQILSSKCKSEHKALYWRDNCKELGPIRPEVLQLNAWFSFYICQTCNWSFWALCTKSGLKRKCIWKTFFFSFSPGAHRRAVLKLNSESDFSAATVHGLLKYNMIVKYLLSSTFSQLNIWANRKQATFLIFVKVNVCFSYSFLYFKCARMKINDYQKHQFSSLSAVILVK